MTVIVDRDLERSFAQLYEIQKQLHSGALSPLQARKPLQDIIEGKLLADRHVVTVSSAGFTSAVKQIAQFREWNSYYDFGFDEEAIDAMLASVPFVDSDDPFVALTLCWTLAYLDRTVNSYLYVMGFVYSDKLYVSPDLRTGSDYLSLPKGAPEFVPNRLWWEITDFGSIRNIAPDQVPAATAAGTSVFAADCHHPAAVRRHNDTDTPYWDVPGLRVSVPGKLRPYAPYIIGESDGYVSVSVRWADYAYPLYAEPVAVR